MLKRPSRPACEIAYYYEWSYTIDMPIRVPIKADGQRGKPEIGFWPEIPDDAKDEDFVEATWPDGHRHDLSDVTYGMLRQITKGRSAKSTNTDGPFWEGEHHATHCKLKLEQRTDRSLLVSLYRGGRQILNAKASDFGELPGDQPCKVPNADETIRKCAAYMIPLCKAYAIGEIPTIQELKKKDQKEYEKATGVKKRSGKEMMKRNITDDEIMRRPAAASAKASKVKKEPKTNVKEEPTVTPKKLKDEKDPELQKELETKEEQSDADSKAKKVIVKEEQTDDTPRPGGPVQKRKGPTADRPSAMRDPDEVGTSTKRVRFAKRLSAPPKAQLDGCGAESAAASSGTIVHEQTMPAVEGFNRRHGIDEATTLSDAVRHRLATIPIIPGSDTE